MKKLVKSWYYIHILLTFKDIFLFYNNYEMQRNNSDDSGVSDDPDASGDSDYSDDCDEMPLTFLMNHIPSFIR